MMTVSYTHLTYFSAIAVSQFISNVPAAMLLAAFSQQREALLLGVNVGGLGTLIASMASVISYKLFAEAYPCLLYTSPWGHGYNVFRGKPCCLSGKIVCLSLLLIHIVNIFTMS